MCGIIAVVSSDIACAPGAVFQLLAGGMRQLLNRGYDSVGICTNASAFLVTSKVASTAAVNAMDEIESRRSLHAAARCGIGHTRWATHGGKTDANSHPHHSFDGVFSLAHNGIIENFKELKAALLGGSHPVTFDSQTDTEVIANLFAATWADTLSNAVEEVIAETMCECIRAVTKQLQGTWGLVIMCTDFPNTVFATRHGSSLLVSSTHNDSVVMVASEQAGFAGRCTTYFALEDGDICTIQPGKVSTNHCYDDRMKHSTAFCDDLTPAPYPHWTLKEIHEQKNSLLRAISFGGRVVDPDTVRLGGLDVRLSELRTVSNIIFLGCGTSLNAAIVGTHLFKATGIFNTVVAIDGADFDSIDFPSLGETAVVFMSQSGETKDLHRCIQIARLNPRAITIGVVNVVDSLIAREVDCGCYLNAGREVGVASTKSFTSQFIMLALMSCWFAQNHAHGSSRRGEILSDIRQVVVQVDELLCSVEERCDHLVATLFPEGVNNCFILGRGVEEAVAREAALKVKEISYVHAEAWSSAALKHGPFALLDEHFPVILLAPEDAHSAKNENAYQEIVSRGAPTLVLTNSPTFAEGKPLCFLLPPNKTFFGVLATIVMQVVAYKLAVGRGINPDVPKNLAKVVTVE